MPLKIVYLLRVWQEVWEGEADALVDLVVLSEGCQGFEVSSSLQEALQGLLFLLQPAQFILEEFYRCFNGLSLFNRLSA